MNSLALPTSVMADESEIRLFSITPPEIGRVESHKDLFVCRNGPTWEKLFMLTRPKESNAVAVVAVNPNGETVLNPVDFSYGPIPALSSITMQQAHSLWAVESDDSSRLSFNKPTYLLKSKTGEDFFLDLVFENDHLKKYRVRSTLLSSSPWSLVN